VKFQGNWSSQYNLESKDKVERHILPHFKTYYRAAGKKLKKE
jgi:hypothetical protein